MGSEEIKKLAKSQFGREAEKYVTSMVHSSDTDLQFVVEFIEPQSSWSVLDIATGTGHLALALAPHVREVVASDITAEMLREAEKLARSKNFANINTEEIDVHSIPYEDNSFDLVTSRIAPHHFHDIESAISEMVRVCKSGGFVFIQDTVAPEDQQASDIFNRIEKLRDPSHVRDLSANQWMNLLTENGGEIKRNHKKSKDWPLKWWTERMLTPRENVDEILRILTEIYEQYHDSIRIRRTELYDSDDFEKRLDAWSMHPHNGYFLAQKI